MTDTIVKLANRYGHNGFDALPPCFRLQDGMSTTSESRGSGDGIDRDRIS